MFVLLVCWYRPSRVNPYLKKKKLKIRIERKHTLMLSDIKKMVMIEQWGPMWQIKLVTALPSRQIKKIPLVQILFFPGNKSRFTCTINASILISLGCNFDRNRFEKCMFLKRIALIFWVWHFRQKFGGIFFFKTVALTIVISVTSLYQVSIF